MANDASTKGPSSLEIAEEQTLLAHDRTLMAWIRTSLSLIPFGFTLYKFSQLQHGDEPAAAAHPQLGPRGYGMAPIGLGVAALAALRL